MAYVDGSMEKYKGSSMCKVQAKCAAFVYNNVTFHPVLSVCHTCPCCHVPACLLQNQVQPCLLFQNHKNVHINTYRITYGKEEE